MTKRDRLWIVLFGDAYLKHPSGPQTTKNPEDAYGTDKEKAADLLFEWTRTGLFGKKRYASIFNYQRT